MVAGSRWRALDQGTRHPNLAPGPLGKSAREMSARAPPKGCSFPRITLPLLMGLSPQQVAGMPLSGRGGGNWAAGGGC